VTQIGGAANNANAFWLTTEMSGKMWDYVTWKSGVVAG
jgi:hypothetical protein